MTIKRLEAEGEGLKRQCAEAQRHLENTLHKNDMLRDDCQKLRLCLSSVQRELSRSKETMASLQEKLTHSKDVWSLVSSDATSTQQSLSKSYTKLVSEHAALQAALTSTEKQKTSLQLELKATHEKVIQLNKERGDLRHSLETVENQLKVVSKACKIQEQEIGSYRQRVSTLEQEKIKLSANLNKVQEDA